MTADDLHDVLRSVPDLLGGDLPDASETDLHDTDTDGPRQTVRRRFLAALGYDPDDATPIEPADTDDRGRIAEGLPLVEHDLPMARRFVLRVGADPARDPPVPDHPEALIYPTLRIVRDALEIDVDYVVQLTDARLVVDGADGSRTYTLIEPDTQPSLPSYEPLTRAGVEDLYARLAVDAGPEDQTSIAEY